MRIAALIRSAGSPFRRLAADQDAAAAVEFALILPIMLALYVSGVSISDAFSIDRKVIIAAHTVADLTARVSTVTDGEVDDILNAAEAVMVPYPTDKLTVTVTSVKIDSNGKATVEWSKASKGGTAQSGDVTSKIPAVFKVPDTGLVWGEANYVYEPAVGYELTGQINLNERTFMRPRLSTVVTKK